MRLIFPEPLEAVRGRGGGPGQITEGLSRYDGGVFFEAS